MQDVKVLIPADLDDVTVKLNADNKVEANFNGLKDYVVSRAAGLITNGYGTLGNNTNFTKFKFDPTQANIGAGAFITATRNADHSIDEIIPVSPGLEYTYSFYAKSLGRGTNNKAYAYIAPIDVEGLPITPIHMCEITFRVEEMQAGKDYFIVHTDDRAMVEQYFRPKAGTNYQMNVLDANYGTSNGFSYPTGTYSRSQLVQDVKQARHLTYDPVTGRMAGHQITSTRVMDTEVGISTAAGTYTYLMPTLTDHVIPAEPTLYTRTFTLENVATSPLHKRMMAVASFIKVGWLLNRGPTSGHETAIWAVDMRAQAPSKIAFTNRDATVDLAYNGIKLLFRQVVGSSRPMVLTGILYQGEWWGDAPNNGKYKNPFD